MKRIAGLAIALICAYGAVVAQRSGAPVPLFLSLNHDLYVYDTVPGALKRLTTWQGNGVPVVSPDGRWIAYTSEANQAREAQIRTNALEAGFEAKNLWLMDTASKRVTRIADQPRGVSIRMSGKPDLYLGRSDPVWSPDGRMLAWTEAFNTPSSQRRLAIYTLTSKTVNTVPLEVNNGSDYPDPLKLKWGAPGIAIGWFDDAIKQHRIDVFSAKTNRIAQYRFTNGRVNINEYNMVWVERAGDWWLGTIESLTLLNPISGAVAQRFGAMRYSRTDAGTSFSIYTRTAKSLILRLLSLGEVEFESALDPLSKYSFRYPDAYPSFAAISPDGKRAVYLERNQNGSSVLWLIERGANNKLQQKVLDVFAKDQAVTGLAWAYTAWNTP